MRAVPLDLDAALATMRAWEETAWPAAFAGSSVWCRAAVRACGAGDLLAACVEDDAGPVAVVVLERDTADWRTGSPGQVRLQWPMQEFGYHFAPAFDPARGAPHGSWIAPLRELFPAERLELRRCAPAAVGEAAALDNLSVTDGASTWRCPAADLATWREGLAGRHRRDLDYYRRRIAKAAGTFTDLQPGEDLDPILVTCFDLHARRVADKGQRSAYVTARGRRFFAALAELHRAGTRLTRLTVDGRVVGSCLSFVHGSDYLCFMPGWDPAWRALDLGRQVIYHQLLGELGRGPTGIDLLGGDLAYKKEFGLAPSPTVDVVAHPTRGAMVREELVRGALGIYRKVVRS